MILTNLLCEIVQGSARNEGTEKQKGGKVKQAVTNKANEEY